MPVTFEESYGSHVGMTVTNLNSLASSATAGWQSARVDNRSTVALDYEIQIVLDMANTAAANDKAVYVYAVPWYNDGSTWYAADGGTTTLPSGTEGTYTLGSPNNLKLLGVLNYTATNQNVQGNFNLKNAFGEFLPDGWSLVLINYTGAAIAATGNMVAYKPLKETAT